MELLRIEQNLEGNKSFIDDPLCKDTLSVTIEYYKRVGFNPPWISYYVRKDHQLVGVAAFKGKPVNNTVEIAYGTFEKYQNLGIGAAICKMLVALAQKTDPTVRITARTLPERNFSARLLEKNSFTFIGTVQDPEDGEVWEWEYR